jgi:hypothetical protein
MNTITALTGDSRKKMNNNDGKRKMSEFKVGDVVYWFWDISEDRSSIILEGEIQTIKIDSENLISYQVKLKKETCNLYEWIMERNISSTPEGALKIFLNSCEGEIRGLKEQMRIAKSSIKEVSNDSR